MRLKLFPLLALELLGSASFARADTLQDVLAQVYHTNPTLNAARAGQKATDEQVAVARANGLPNASVSARYTQAFESQNDALGNPLRNGNATVSLSVPIYSGGAVRNGIRAADARVDAGRANLRGTESGVFAQVVAAYMDVIYNEALVDLNRQQVKVLDVNLQSTRDRFQVGDLTRTDIAQSEARLAAAEANAETADSNLIGARETFIRLVGIAPRALQTPPTLPNFPDSPDTAVQTALAHNPDLIAANKEIEAARFDTAVARAARLPKISGVASGTYTNNFNSARSYSPLVAVQQSDRYGAIGLQATIPLYQGGGPSAQVRAANDRNSQAIENAIATERSIIAQARAAFASWRASNQVIESSQKQVSAAELSLEGVRAENSVGNRTILDILNAEQELTNARGQLLLAQRNAYVAGFSLLAAMGKAEARELGLDGGALYDPITNYNNAHRSYSDWSDGPAPTAHSTRTIDIPAQTPALTK
jgi:outer membrane protein